METTKILLNIGICIIFHSVFLAVIQFYDSKFQHVYYGDLLFPGIFLVGASFIIPRLEFSQTNHLEIIFCSAAFAVSLFAYFRLLLLYYKECERKVLISIIHTVLAILCGTISGLLSSKYSVILWICFVFVHIYNIVLWIRDLDKRVEKEEKENLEKFLD